MAEIELQIPTMEHRDCAEAFKREFLEHKESVINGSALLDQMEYEPWLLHVQNSRRAETASPDWVVATTFFAVRKEDNRIVGIIDVRHNLEHDFLRQYGGHIGYAVRPSERKKGYATAMLKLALDELKSIGVPKAMLGCYSDNIPSIKTITGCGGMLIETKPYADGKPMNIYWIALGE